MNRKIIDMTPDHWPAVREIYAQGIATGHATFETEVPGWEEFDGARRPDCRLVAVDDEGTVLGWAALSPVSRRPVYVGVAEVTVYVHEDARGQGVGTDLLAALVEDSEVAGFWTLQASVFPENKSTLRLHKRQGFRQVGRRERIGRQGDRWRDTLLLERRSPVVE